MKVIKSGDGRRGWATEATCTGKGNGDGGCGALLKVEQADVFATLVSNGYDEPKTRVGTFLCPECWRPTDLGTEADLPFELRDPLPEEKAKVYR
jgi:hypothetical protein